MANYLMKQIADTNWNIVLSGSKIGFVRKLTTGDNAGRYVARIRQGEVVIRATARDAFSEAVAIENRIALCGKNDPALAEQKLIERNNRIIEQAAADQAAWNALCAPMRVRVRSSKIRL